MLTIDQYQTAAGYGVKVAEARRKVDPAQARRYRREFESYKQGQVDPVDPVDPVEAEKLSTDLEEAYDHGYNSVPLP